MGSGFNPTVSYKAFMALMKRVEKLEADMKLCKKILDIQNEPLRPKKNEALGLLEASEKALKSETWSLQELEIWASVYDKVDELTLRMFKNATGEYHSYNHLIKLCLAQLEFMIEKPETQLDGSWNEVYKKLEGGRKVMRTAILAWLNTTGQLPPTEILQKLETDKGALFTRLSNGKAKGTSH